MHPLKEYDHWLEKNWEILPFSLKNKIRMSDEIIRSGEVSAPAYEMVEKIYTELEQYNLTRGDLPAQLN